MKKNKVQRKTDPPKLPQRVERAVKIYRSTLPACRYNRRPTQKQRKRRKRNESLKEIAFMAISAPVLNISISKRSCFFCSAQRPMQAFPKN